MDVKRGGTRFCLNGMGGCWSREWTLCYGWLLLTWLDARVAWHCD